MSYDKNENVDYNADNTTDFNAVVMPVWQKIVFFVLVLIILVSFAVVIIQMQQLAGLTEQNDNLKATVTTLQQILRMTPTP